MSIPKTRIPHRRQRLDKNLHIPIKFGTDGWRGVIGEDFTIDNIRLCAQGTSSFLIERNLASPGLVIGYDTRTDSKEFADIVAGVSTANNVTTFLCDKAAPTPAIAYTLVARHAGGGAVITASHNPAHWNGYKFKPDYGGSASPEIVAELERHIADVPSPTKIARMPIERAAAIGLLEYIDPEPSYLGHISNLVDLEGIRRSGLRVVVDAMFGAGATYFTKLLSGGNTRITEIHSERNPTFPGISQPEPIAQNLGTLASVVASEQATVGIAIDGDGDRLGIVDEKGQFMTSLQTFALLCLHQLEVLKKRGAIIRSITMTSIIDKLGAMYDVPVFDTPVGFKYLGPVMMRENALIAGEESGGYAFQGNIPERDGILSGLMFLDMLVKTGKSPSDLAKELAEKVGPHHYERWDLKFNPRQRDQIQAKVMASKPSKLGGKNVERIDTRDGFRFMLENGYWALIRFSGTEPLLRIYAEAESPEMVIELLNEARELTRV